MRHVLSLSGGKDSAALAIYMRDRVPEMEYVFSDTGKELPETYEYLERIEDYLGQRVNRLNSELSFDHWYDVYGGMIPSNHRRWCTKMLKLKPFEAFVGDDPVINYVGLRADENRTGYISHKPNITPVYPFQQDGLKLADIEEILMSSGVGMPPYTAWGRSRSGCFFCFYQQKIEWVRLKRNTRTSSTRPSHTSGLSKAVETPSLGANVSRFRNSGNPIVSRRSRMNTPDAKLRRSAAGADLTLAEVYRRRQAQDDADSAACLICTL